MKEQEKLKVVLQHIVKEAENYNIVTTDELLNMLVNELSDRLLVTVPE